MDPATAIKEACAESHCTSYKAKLDECNDRVKSKNKTTETCFEEILDFYHCVDHCAASSIFQVSRMENLFPMYFSFISTCCHVYTFNHLISFSACEVNEIFLLWESR